MIKSLTKNLSFQRVISSGKFIPELDGLRFIAITSVVIHHINGFLVAKDSNTYIDDLDYSVFNTVFSLGYLGVPLFFLISGFILGKPFTSHYLAGTKKIALRKYFLRRLSRLEPPYIIAMTILFIGTVYVARQISLSEAIFSYLASITYTHNFIYGREIMPLLNSVAWSLEIEVQFYILAPLLAYLFLIKERNKRRSMLFSMTVFFLIIDYIVVLPFRSLIDYFEYFLAGLILADYYVTQNKIFNSTKFDNLICTLLFISIWLFNESLSHNLTTKLFIDIIQLASLFLFCYYVLFHKTFRFLTIRVVTDIGGMCYTIYLLHYPIISMFGNPLMNVTFSDFSLVNILIYSLILISVIAVISALFFLVIERPCMQKDWYKFNSIWK